MISIIVPIYKVEKYLPKCIESLINQTYKYIEIILVDDGSPDGCGEICDRYATLDQRIVVIHQKNAGVSAARNAGLAIAQGEYIGFVDPDDWVSAEMFEGMLSVIVQEDTDLAICGYDYYDENGNVDDKRRYSIRPNEHITQKEVMYRFADMPPSIRHGVCNKLFKYDLLHGMTFNERLHSSEDVLFLNEYVCKINSAVIVHQPYYKNLVRQGSATHGGLRCSSLMDSYVVHEKMYLDTVSKYPDIKNHALAFLMDVFFLKYGMMKNSENFTSCYSKKVKSYFRRYMWKSFFDKEIYWKTRIMYIIEGIRG